MVWAESHIKTNKQTNIGLPLNIRDNALDNLTFNISFCLVSFVCFTGARLARVKSGDLITEKKEVHVDLGLLPFKFYC